MLTQAASTMDRQALTPPTIQGERPQSRSRSSSQRKGDPPACNYVHASPPRTTRNHQHNTNTNPKIQPLPQAAPYKLGQEAHPADIVNFNSISEAHTILPTLPIGTPLFVKRSNRDWTYARIVSYRRPDSGAGLGVGACADENDEYWNEGKENFIVVALDEDYSMRKFIQREKWHSCVRLVRFGALGGGAAKQQRYSRHNSQPEQRPIQQRIPRRSSAPSIISTSPNTSPIRLGRNDGSIFVTHSESIHRGSSQSSQPGMYTQIKPLMPNPRSGSADSSTAATTSVSSPGRRMERHRSAPPVEPKSERMPKSVNDNFEPASGYRRSKSMHIVSSVLAGASTTAAGGTHTDFKQSNSGPGSRHPAPIRMSKSATSFDALKKSLPSQEDDEITVAGVAVPVDESTKTESNPYVRNPEISATLTASRSSPSTLSITNSAGSSSSDSSPKEAAIDLGPAKVNLNARHFCGKRRYRMRPQKRRGSDIL